MNAQTTLLFWRDTFLFSAPASVLDVQIEGDNKEGTNNNKQAIILDSTIFYPAGGGQPSDTGSIYNDTATFKVSDVKLVDRKTVLHYGTYEGEGRLKVGDKVEMKVDQDKRVLHAKLHSAGHLLDSALENIGVKLIPGKGYHYPDGPYVEYTGKIAAEKRDEFQKSLEIEANRMITSSGAGAVVGVEMAMPDRVKELVGNFPEYLPKDSEARMVNVGGVWCPCGGTHVSTLSQIGNIKVTKVRVQKDKTRISYAVS